MIILFVLGLCFGSFVNALVWRLHEQSKLSKSKSSNSKTKKLSTKDLSILKGRSMCPQCHHNLAWADLIPIYSWLWLKGRCRYCKKTISFQYPAVELITSLLFVFSYAFWGSEFNPAQTALFAIWLIIITLFVAMFVYDLHWMILPNQLTYSLLVLAIIGLIVKLIWLNEPAGEVITTALWGLLCLGGLFYLLFQISGGKWIGGGDVKLGFGLGILLGGPLLSLATLFTASLIGTIIAIILIILRKDWRHRRIPFGSMLLVAAFFIYIFTSQISDKVASYLLI